MRQTISAVIEHTTKEELERRARDLGMPLSRYIRKVLEEHENTAFVSKADRAAKVQQVLEDYDNT